MKNTKLEKRFNSKVEKIVTMNKPSKRGIFLSIIVLFSISLVLTPLNGYAEEINVKSVGVDKTTIITLTNDAKEDVKTFRIWLGGDTNFKSFKTEKGWIGEKNPQGVIIFTSLEPIKMNESVKFGVKTDKLNSIINWKALDQTNTIIDTGVVKSTEIKKVEQNPDINLSDDIKNSKGEIFSDSTFRIIPDKPNSGSTIRVIGNTFEASQIFDFYLNTQKIGIIETDEKGHFITTIQIPNNESDRVEFKIKNDKGQEKTISIRLGSEINRISATEDIKITIQDLQNTIYRGESININGMGTPNTSLTLQLLDVNQKIINTRIAKIDGTGNWKISQPIIIPFDINLGKYSIVVSDGRNHILKNIFIETDKVIQISPTKIMFDEGEIIKLDGTGVPNSTIEFILEDNLGNEKYMEIKNTDDTGFVEFEYQTIENDDNVGTWTLISTQGNSKEFTYVGYGIIAVSPINFEFDKINYKINEIAKLTLIGTPSDKVIMNIIGPTGSFFKEGIEINLQEDGRGKYNLDLKDFGSGIYTAIIKQQNTQSDEMFTVGLQMGSGKIDIKTTQLEYTQGDKILLLGNTNPNVLLKAILINPSGDKVRTIEIPSDSSGMFSEDRFKIPQNAEVGLWKIQVSSGSNLATNEFQVNTIILEGLGVVIGETTSIPGIGTNVKIIIQSTYKSSIQMQIIDKNQIVIDNLNCNTTSEFKCEIFWTIPQDIIPGTYTVKADNVLDSTETQLIIK